MSDNAVLANEGLYTYADYKNWDLEPLERYELIDGIPYAMAAPTWQHQEILAELALQFGNFLKGKPCKVIFAPLDVRLFAPLDDAEDDESDMTVVQPDLIVVCDKRKMKKEGCRGAPEFVVEIISPSNTHREMDRKMQLYRESGVKEYWEIYPEDRRVKVYLFDERNNAQDEPCREYRVDKPIPVATLPGLEVNLGDVITQEMANELYVDENLRKFRPFTLVNRAKKDI